MHSSASDGQHSPAQVAALVKARGAQCWALTDHDTLDGLSEARSAAIALGLRFIPGIELSAKEYHTFHILGYCFDPGNPALAALCQRMKEGRDARKYKIIDFLEEKGLKITIDEVESVAGGNLIARPHFARVLVARGYVPDNRSAFDLYLDTDEYHDRVERDKPSVRECVETIRAAGGYVSLAHPYQIGLDNDALDGLVGKLADIGIDAIECFYPRYNYEQTAFYLSLTRKYGLHYTGGSDFHGVKVKPDIQIGAIEMELDWLLQENA